MKILSYPAANTVSPLGLVSISEKTGKTRGMCFSGQEAVEGSSALGAWGRTSSGDTRKAAEGHTVLRSHQALGKAMM